MEDPQGWATFIKSVGFPIFLVMFGGFLVIESSVCVFAAPH